MPLETPDQTPFIPYQLPFPRDALAEIVVPRAIPEDERLWVPQADQVWFRPLCLNRSQGYWVNLFRVRRAGVLSRHRHPQAVHGFVLKGRWHYLEHDWLAEGGADVFEPPGVGETLAPSPKRIPSTPRPQPAPGGVPVAPRAGRSPQRKRRR